MQSLHPKAVWMFYVLPFLATLLILVLIDLVALLCVAVVSSSSEALSVAGIYLSLFTFPAAALIAYWCAKLEHRNFQFAVTDTHVRIEQGVIWKRHEVIPYDRIQHVDVRRGALARLIGLSEVFIQTAGATHHLGRATEGELPGVEKATAEKLRDRIMENCRGHRGQGVKQRTEQQVQRDARQARDARRQDLQQPDSSQPDGPGCEKLPQTV